AEVALRHLLDSRHHGLALPPAQYGPRGRLQPGSGRPDWRGASGLSGSVAQIDDRARRWPRADGAGNPARVFAGLRTDRAPSRFAGVGISALAALARDSGCVDERPFFPGRPTGHGLQVEDHQPRARAFRYRLDRLERRSEDSGWVAEELLGSCGK